MSFSFGNNNNNNPPAAGGAPAPVFGSNNNNNNNTTSSNNAAGTGAPPAAPVFGAGTAPATAAPAPTGGFSFGGGAAAGAPATTAAPATTTTQANAFAAGASSGSATSQPPVFGGSTGTATTAASTTTTGIPGFGTNNNNTAAAPGPTTAPAPTGPSFTKVPLFEETFPGLTMMLQMRATNLISNVDMVLKEIQGGDLWKQHAANPTLRQTLHQQRTVLLSAATLHRPVPTTSAAASPHQPDVPLQQAHLNDEMLQELFQLADDLGLTEEQALSLLAESKQHASSSAEALYWAERKTYLQSLLLMFQKRFALAEEDASSVSEADKELALQTNQLLQKGLVKSLIQLIQSFTQRLDKLFEQRRRYQTETSNSTLMTNDDDATRARQFKVLKMHIDFGIEQRQVASETLFFVAYNFCLSATEELVPMIRLVRDLSGGDANNLQVSPGLRPLDPHNVPSANVHVPSHHAPPPTFYGWAAPPAPTPQEEKNPFVWQKELVQQTWEHGHPQLLRCVATLLMTVVTALDQRQSLVDRSTGQCKLVTPDTTHRLLQDIHPVLFDEVWHTPHVLGILFSCYALILQATDNPAIASPLSPRVGPSTPFSLGGTDGPMTDVRRAFRCALESPGDFKTFTFARLSLIPALQMPPTSEACPVSEFLLSVLTDLTSQYFRLLLDRNPPISRSKWKSDAEEDLNLRRTDQKNYVDFQNWSGTRERLEAIPTSVNPLDRPDCMDDVLALCNDICQLGPNFSSLFWSRHNLPDVFACVDQIQTAEQDSSLLPAFVDLLTGLAVHRADLVHQILSSPREVSAPMSGDNIHVSLRWADILHTIRFYARQLVEKSGGTRTTSNGGTSAAVDQSTMYYYFSTDSNPAGSKPTSSTSTTSGPRELGELNEFILSSHLQLVEAVASRSSDARAFLRQLSIPIASGGNAIGQDMLWNVLFTLTNSPICPELRGQVFEALASIMDGSSPEEIQQAWEWVENAGILPIDKLLVYPTPLQGDVPGLTFPPSSTARVREKHCKSWIPADPSYALIYEMEYIEASRGIYPSTCGFLQLLLSLVSAGGCPSDIGRNWRSRTGCSPYIEYVIHLVLPRAVGTFTGLPSLPFRSTGDKDHMLSLGLSVVSACLQRYIVPDFSREQEPTMATCFSHTKKEAKNLISLDSLVDQLVVPVGEEEFKTYLNDFAVSFPLNKSNAQNLTAPGQVMLNSSVPSPKSPGFTILCEMLNRTGSTLMDVVRKLLEEGLNRSGDVDEFACAYAIYGATPPNMKSAKAGHKYSIKHLLLPIRAMDHIDVETASSRWDKRSSTLLEILCYVACREKDFASSVECYRGSGTVVPVVKFLKRPSAPDVKETQISHLGPILSQQLQAIVGFAGNLNNDITVARAAFGFILYLHKANQHISPPELLVHAVSRRIVHLAERCDGGNMETELFTALLDRSLASLQAKTFSPLIGIPGHQDALRALLQVLSADDLLAQAPVVAANAYKVVYHAMSSHTVVLHLSTNKFWTEHLSSVFDLVRSGGSNDANELWWCICWILAGLAEELHLLLSTAGYNATFLQRPQKYDEIMKVLFAEETLKEIVLSAPLTDAKLSETLTSSLHHVIGASVLCGEKFQDAIEITEVLDIVLARLGGPAYASASRNMSLAAFLSMHFKLISSRDDPVPYVHSLANLISKGGQSGIVAAASLANTLCHSPDIPADELQQDTLLTAASVLLRISCAASNTIPAEPTSDALIARSCLKTVLPTMDENLVHRLLTDHGDFGRASTALGAWINLLGKNDEDITSVLQLLPLFSFGSDLLLDADILRGLDEVAQRIASHMAALESNNFQVDRIAVPKCWQSHLDLMSLILLNTSHNRRVEASNHVLRILSHNENAAERLLSSFPNDGDTAVAYTKCCAVAVELAGSKQLTVQASSPRIPAIKSLSLLAFQIAENPLPRGLADKLPATLQKQRLKSNLVSISSGSQNSWWDSLDSSDCGTQESFIYYFGVMGLNIARTGLVVVRENEDMMEKVDMYTIARGLCRITDALKKIVSIEQQQSLSLQQMDQSTAKERRNMTTALCQTLAELLHLAIDVLKGQHDAYQKSLEMATWDEVAKPFKVALEYTRLDKIGIASNGDENTRDHIIAVAGILRSMVVAQV